MVSMASQGPLSAPGVKIRAVAGALWLWKVSHAHFLTAGVLLHAI